MPGITINPALVSNAAGKFSLTTDGYVQGTAQNDPAVRNWLAQGLVAVAQTTPLWGGMAITDSLANPAVVSQAIGTTLALATAQSNITGFTVFDQATAMVQSPQSPVPLAPAGDNVSKPGGFINYYRLGSGARIVVACSAAVAAALESGATNQALYWDYTNQVLLNAPGGTALANVKVLDVNVGNSKIVVYNSGTGFATWNESGSSAVIQI